jgi:hypothetical protein
MLNTYTGTAMNCEALPSCRRDLEEPQAALLILLKKPRKHKIKHLGKL